MRAPVTVGIMDQSVDDTVPDLAGQVDHAKSVACNVNGIPNQDPAAWRWDDADPRDARGRVDCRQA